jgi:putative transposase
VLLGHIEHAWLESGGVYGYRTVHTDLQELGIDCGKHRVCRLMRAEGLRSQSGYRRRPSPRGGRPSVVAPNRLQQERHVAEPNQVWVTDITYIRTCEGWLMAIDTPTSVAWAIDMAANIAKAAANLIFIWVTWLRPEKDR